MAKSGYYGPNTYDGFDGYLGRKDRRKLSHNVYAVRDGADITIVYHWTAIIRYRPDGRVVLNSGGFRTVTTKSNLNQYSDCSVWQSKHVWYVSFGDSGTSEFEDGVEYDGVPTESNMWVCTGCNDHVVVEDDYDDIPYCTDCSRKRTPAA